MDARSEVERWADHPVEFHFATILSPWIRRALVAGGFGTGTPSPDYPHELVQVVSYGDVRNPEVSSIPEKADVENGIVEEDLRRRPSHSLYSAPSDPGPLELQDTPFFHFDVVSAVRAAESGLNRRDSSTPSVSSVNSGKKPAIVQSEEA